MGRLRPNNAGRDRINKLPDDILLHILSFMTTRGAVTTSALSRKWQHLWKFSFKKLSFDDFDILGPRSRKIEDAETIFAKLVNHVMDQYQRSELVQLNIIYRRLGRYFPGLPPEFGDDVLGRWFSFALTKKVEVLNLGLGTSWWTLPSLDDQLSSTSCFKTATLTCFTLVGRSFQIFKSIKSLHLYLADLKPSDFGSIFSNCPSLENLMLDTLFGVEYVSIVESSLKLISLEIYDCNLNRIELNAPELRKLTCNYGLTPEIETDWKIDTPKLDELNLSFPYRKFQNRANDVFGCYFSKGLSRLQTMVLQIFPHEVQLATLPTLPNLKTLVLEVVRSRDENYLAFACLLQASPFLRRFELQLLEASKGYVEPQTSSNEEREMEDDNLVWHHRCLEEVYVGGFCGYECELELLNYLLNTSTSLKKIILDPYDFQTRWTSNIEEKEAGPAYLDVQTRARQFRKDVRSDIQLVVL